LTKLSVGEGWNSTRFPPFFQQEEKEKKKQENPWTQKKIHTLFKEKLGGGGERFIETVMGHDNHFLFLIWIKFIYVSFPPTELSYIGI
jgi:hypothetical protein